MQGSATSCSTARNAAGLATRPVWTLMHRLPMYRRLPAHAICRSPKASSGAWSTCRAAPAWRRRARLRSCSAGASAVVTGSRADYGLLDLADARDPERAALRAAARRHRHASLARVRHDRRRCSGTTVSPSTRASRCCCRARRRRRRRQVDRARRDRLRRRLRAAEARSRGGARRPLRDPGGGAGGAVHAPADRPSAAAATSPKAPSTSRFATPSPRWRICISPPTRSRRGACGSSARTRSASSPSAAPGIDYIKRLPADDAPGGGAGDRARRSADAMLLVTFHPVTLGSTATAARIRRAARRARDARAADRRWLFTLPNADTEGRAADAAAQSLRRRARQCDRLFAVLGSAALHQPDARGRCRGRQFVERPL